MRNIIVIFLLACLIFSCKKEKVENPILKHSGKVWDAYNDKPIADAEVKIVERNGELIDSLPNKHAIVKTKSDSNGVYDISFISEKEKDYFMIIQKKDFWFF